MGAISALAASIVLTFATIQIQGHFKQLASASKQLEWSKALSDEFGATFQQAFFRYDPVRFTPASSDFTGQARLLLDPEARKDESGARIRRGELFVHEFPVSPGKYQIALIDKDGNIVKSADGKGIVTIGEGFESSAESRPLIHVRISIQVDQLDSGHSLAIIAPGQERAVVGKLAL